MSKKRLSRRDFLNMSVGAAAAGALAACGAQPTPETVVETVVVEKEVEKIVEVTGEAPAAEVYVLTLGQTWDIAFRGHQEEFDNNFMANHPEIVLKRVYNTWGEHNQIIPTWAAAGTLPDIVYTHGSRALPWGSEGINADITAFAEGDAEFNVDGIFEEALNLYKVDGKITAIPYDHGPVILGYNKDLFDEAGMDYPDDTWTMDDMLEAAIALTKPNQYGYAGYYNGIVNLGNELGIALVGPFGGKVFNDDESELLIDSDESIAGLNWFADLIHEHKVAPTPAEAGAIPAGAWVSGQAAMFGLASWGTPQLSEFATFGWDVAPWPEGPAGRKTGSFGSGFGITRDSQNPDAAWSYLREYLSADGMAFMWGASGRGSPAREEAYQSWMDSEPAPDNAKYYLDALKNYAETGHPYKSLNAEIGRASCRERV